MEDKMENKMEGITEEKKDQLMDDIDADIFNHPEDYDWDNKYEYGFGYHE